MNLPEYWILSIPLMMALLLLTAVYITRKLMKLDQLEAANRTPT